MVRKDDCYRATVYYAGGSIKQKDYYIKWSNKYVNIHESHIELPFVSSKQEMNTMLNGVLDEFNIKTFHVLDVGQGSSNIINYENGDGEDKYLFMILVFPCTLLEILIIVDIRGYMSLYHMIYLMPLSFPIGMKTTS